MTLKEDKPERVFSFEFFPPKSEKGWERLINAAEQLKALGPRYFSVTFGAGGSTRERTYETVSELLRHIGVPTAPHLSCIAATEDSLRALLDDYAALGVERIVALRGDMPSGMVTPGAFRYANELVEFIRKEYGSRFKLEVGCYPEYHPEAPSALDDLRNFKRKVDAGADAAITQYFFNADAYFQFVEDARSLGVEIPIVPGIMPIVNFQQLCRFSDICGAEIPRWIRRRLESYGDDTESIRAFGHDVVTRMCGKLLEGGAPGLHFYALNNAGPSLGIWRDLGLPIPAHPLKKGA